MLCTHNTWLRTQLTRLSREILLAVYVGFVCSQSTRMVISQYLWLSCVKGMTGTLGNFIFMYCTTSIEYLSQIVCTVTHCHILRIRIKSCFYFLLYQL